MLKKIFRLAYTVELVALILAAQIVYLIFSSTSGIQEETILAALFAVLECSLFLICNYWLILLSKVWQQWGQRTLSVITQLFRQIGNITFIVIYVVQGYGLWVSDSYTTVLAIENESEGVYIPLYHKVLLITIGAIYISMSLTSSAWKSIGNTKFRRLLFFAFSLLIVAFTVSAISAGAAPKEANGVRRYHAPATSMYLAVKLAREIKDYTGNASALVAGREAYPYYRQSVFVSPQDTYTAKDSPWRPNIVVLFIEGFSSLLKTAKIAEVPIMPKSTLYMNKFFAERHKYFNHTAATFRGIQGQLSSSYPRVGGVAPDGGGWLEGVNGDYLRRTNYSTVPRILASKGYQTIFVAAHNEANPINLMYAALGINDIYAKERIEKDLFGLEPSPKSWLDDKVFLDGLWKLLQSNRTNSPFFLGAYNLGTHAWFDSPAAATKFPAADNLVANRFYYFDIQLANFLNNFFKSKFKENTILILTADHATYPDKDYHEFLKLSGQNPNGKRFIDEIPLLIYSPKSLPMTLTNQDVRCSIDLAPTILELANVGSVAHSFLGRSLFDPKTSNRDFCVAAIGNSFFWVDRTAVTDIDQISDNTKRALAEVERQKIRRFYAFEYLNRIVPPIQ